MINNTTPADSRRCPQCAELIKKKAILCKHCRSEIPVETDNAKSMQSPDFMSPPQQSNASSINRNDDSKITLPKAAVVGHQIKCISCGNTMSGQSKVCSACGTSITEVATDRIIKYKKALVAESSSGAAIPDLERKTEPISQVAESIKWFDTLAVRADRSKQSKPRPALRRATIGVCLTVVVLATYGSIRFVFGKGNLDHQLQQVLDKRDYLYNRQKEYMEDGARNGYNGGDRWAVDQCRLNLEIGSLYEKRGDLPSAIDYYNLANNAGPGRLELVPESKICILLGKIRDNPELQNPTNRNNVYDSLYHLAEEKK